MATAEHRGGYRTRPGWPAGLRPAVPLAVIVALGMLVRFPTLGHQSFWFDEAMTRSIVAHGLGHVLRAIPDTEKNPPAYYLLAWLWARLFGVGEVGLRSLSAVCGTLMIPAIWVLARRLADLRTAIIAALLTAASPLLFWYSQEARPYALLALVVVISMIALVRALERATTWPLLVWGLTAALALCTHYFSAFVIAPEAAWLLVGIRRRELQHPTRRILLAVGPVVVAAAALAPLALEQNTNNLSWISDQGSMAYRLGVLAGQDITGLIPPQGIAASAIAAQIALGAVAGVVVLVGFVRFAGVGLRTWPRLGMPLAVGAGGLGLAVIAGLLVHDYVDTRNLLPTWPALLLLLAGGLAAPPAKARGPASVRGARFGLAETALLAALSLGFVLTIDLNPLFQRADWRGAARVLGAPSGTRAIVSGNLALGSLEPYMLRLAAYPPQRLSVREIDVIAVEHDASAGHGAGTLPSPIVAKPPPAGFQLVRVVKGSDYIVLGYRSRAPLAVSVASLARLALTESPTVMVQRF